MSMQYERLQEGFATVYLTLVSVIIALALEKLFDRMVAVAPLPPADLAGALTWLQGGALLVGAFAMFVISSYLVLALRWDIGVLDAAAPFLLLIVLAAAITAVGHGDGKAFFYIAALGQFGGGQALAQILREAEDNPANAAVLGMSDLRTTYLAGTVSWVVPLVTAVLLHVGLIGAVGAVVGASILLLAMLALVQTFSDSWWQAVREADWGPGGGRAGDDAAPS